MAKMNVFLMVFFLYVRIFWSGVFWPQVAGTVKVQHASAHIILYNDIQNYPRELRTSSVK